MFISWQRKRAIIDYVALYKSLMLVGTIFLLMFIITYSPFAGEKEYKCETGIVVNKYIDSGATYRATTYNLVVDCNGTNRTHVYNCYEIHRWKNTSIGDIQKVCYKV